MAMRIVMRTHITKYYYFFSKASDENGHRLKDAIGLLYIWNICQLFLSRFVVCDADVYTEPTVHTCQFTGIDEMGHSSCHVTYTVSLLQTGYIQRGTI